MMPGKAINRNDFFSMQETESMQLKIQMHILRLTYIKWLWIEMTLTFCRDGIVYFYCHPAVPWKRVHTPLRHEKTLIVLTLQCEQVMDMDNQVAAVAKRSVVRSCKSVTEMLFSFRHLTLFSMKCWAVCTKLQWNTNLLFSILNV